MWKVLLYACNHNFGSEIVMKNIPSCWKFSILMGKFIFTICKKLQSLLVMDVSVTFVLVLLRFIYMSLTV